MIGPEIDQHLVQLPLRENGSGNCELLELACEAPQPVSGPLPASPGVRRPVHGLRAVSHRQLAAPALLLFAEEHVRQVVGGQLQDIEVGQGGIQPRVRGGLRVELLLDPPVYARCQNPFHVSGPGPERETVEGVESPRPLEGVAGNRDCHARIWRPGPGRGGGQGPKGQSESH